MELTHIKLGKLNDIVDSKLIGKLELEIDKLTKENETLLSAYKNAYSSSLRTQLLSLVPESYSLKAIQIVFGVSEYQIKIARKHALDKMGMIVEKNIYYRNRLDSGTLSQFIDFITSPDYLHDVAFGDRLLKTQISGTICIPDSIRLAPHIKIVDDYFKAFKEEELPTLGRSTCFKILKNCAASFKKSFQGLDNVMADGLDAFDKLETILKTLQTTFKLSNENYKVLHDIIDSSQCYIKWKFRHNLSIYNECADHCVSFALSQENSPKTKVTTYFYDYFCSCLIKLI